MTERGLLLDKNGDERVFGNILCAVAAGAISSAIANPTDVLKVRMQVHGRGTEQMGLFGCFKQIYRIEGVTGLWRVRKNLKLKIMRNVFVANRFMERHCQRSVVVFIDTVSCGSDMCVHSIVE